MIDNFYNACAALAISKSIDEFELRMSVHNISIKEFQNKITQLYKSLKVLDEFYNNDNGLFNFNQHFIKPLPIIYSIKIEDEFNQQFNFNIKKYVLKGISPTGNPWDYEHSGSSANDGLISGKWLVQPLLIWKDPRGMALKMMMSTSFRVPHSLNGSIEIND